MWVRNRAGREVEVPDSFGEKELRDYHLTPISKKKGEGSIGDTAETSHARNKAMFEQYKGIVSLSEPVRIILPVYDQLDITKQCISSLHATLEGIPWVLTIIDNASSKATAAYLRRLTLDERIEVIREKENLGFVKAANEGMRKPGEWVVILNNDIVLSPGWLESMIRTAMADPAIGMVCPTTNRAALMGNVHKLAGFQAWPHDDDFSEDGFDRHSKELRVVWKGRAQRQPYLNFYCTLFRRSMINEVGYLDEAFGPGLGDDDDYCIRAQKAGWRLAVALDAFVFHHRRTTFEAVHGKSGYQEIQDRNSKILEGKHGSDLAILRELTDIPRRRLKVGIGITTYNRLDSLKVVVETLLKTIAAEKHDVRVIVADDGSIDGTPHWLLQGNVEFIRGLNRGVAANKNRLLGLLRDCDAIFLAEDDIEFIKTGWIDYYISGMAATGIHYFLLLPPEMYPHAMGEKEVNGWKVRYSPNTGGFFCAMSKHALEVLGGMGSGYKGYGHAHVEYDHRANAAGLSGRRHDFRPFAHLAGAEQFIRYRFDVKPAASKAQRSKEAADNREIFMEGYRKGFQIWQPIW